MSAREVTLYGGSPWGFRMHGGCDTHQPLRISRVNPGSKAAQQGIREGDLISSINGRSTRELTNSEAHAQLRNSGEQLKLGLNQDNIGSPKRRIYKSTLQQNTITEIQNKTTTKTTTTTRTRAGKEQNVANDTKAADQSYVIRNGALRSCSSEQQSDITKGHRASPDYASDAEDIEMPQGNARNRSHGRKNRNRRRAQQLAAVAESSRNGERRERETAVAACPKSERDNDDDTKTNDSIPENVDATRDDNCDRSLNRGYKFRPDDRRSIEKIELRSRPRTVEITTFSSLPLEATIDHIAGVGILETGRGDMATKGTTVMTVLEPLEPFEPLTDHSRIKRRSFDGSVGRNPWAKEDELEIREVGDSDVEIGCDPTTIEVESDVERKLSGESDPDAWERFEPSNQIGQQCVPQKRLSDPEMESAILKWDTVVPKKMERKFPRKRNFPESLHLPSFFEEVIEEKGHGERFTHEAAAEKDKSIEKTTASLRKKVRKRATSELHCPNSFLNIIQEEGEKLSEDEAQHIRDFINEEISKYRRTYERTAEDEAEDDRCKDIVRACEQCEIDVETNIDTMEDNVCIESRLSDAADNGGKLATAADINPAENTQAEVIKDINSVVKMTDEELNVIDNASSNELVETTSDGIQSILNSVENHIKEIDIPERDVINDDEKGLLNKESISGNNAEADDISILNETNDVHEGEDNKLLHEIETTEEAENCGNHKVHSSFDTNARRNGVIPSETKRFISPPLPPKRSSSLSHEFQRLSRSIETENQTLRTNIYQSLTTNNEGGYGSTNLLARRDMDYKTKVEKLGSPESSECDSSSVSKTDRAICETDSSDSYESSSLPNIIRADEIDRCTRQAERVGTASKSVHIEPASAEAGPSIALSVICDDDPHGVETLGVALAGATSTEITYREEGKPATPVASAAHVPSAPSNRQGSETDMHRYPSDTNDTGRLGREEEGSLLGFRHERTVKNEISDRRIIERHEEISSIDRRDDSHDSNYSSRDLKREERHENSNLRSEASVSPDREMHETSFQKADVVPADGNLSPIEAEAIDLQERDSSSSAASLSTVRHHSLNASLADISMIIRETKDDNFNDDAIDESLKQKLTLLKNGESSNVTSRSPQPIPYSPIEDLHCAPLNVDEDVLVREEREDASKNASYPTSHRPFSLRELCVKKILSMPFGSQIISEITTWKFNIFEGLRSLQRFVSNVPSARRDNARLKPHGVNERRPNDTAGLTNASSSRGLLHPNDLEHAVSDQIMLPGGFNIETRLPDFESERRNWKALSTSRDPRLLVCLSPSQQATSVRTSADALLDLHQKFLKRYSYREEQPHHAPLLQYRVHIRPTVNVKEANTKTSIVGAARCDAVGSNRLLKIIKEHSSGDAGAQNAALASRQSKIVNGSSDTFKRDKHEEHLNATRLDGCLNGVNRHDRPSAAVNGLFLDLAARSEDGRDDKLGHAMPGYQSRIAPRPVVEVKYRRSGDNTIIRGSERPGASTELFESAIKSNSAVVDRSSGAAKRPWRTSDFGKHVNPALIDDKLKVPPLPKRVVTVDRSCIDVTSIFDQNPPRNPPEPPKDHEMTEKLIKHMAAVEIMDKLKKLQTETSQRLGDRRSSLPQECFAQQLKYIELLEEQLKNVILAEEEERKAFEELQNHVRWMEQLDGTETLSPDVTHEDTAEKVDVTLERKDEIRINNHRVIDGKRVANRRDGQTDVDEDRLGRARRVDPETSMESWRRKSLNSGNGYRQERTEMIDGQRQSSNKINLENGVCEGKQGNTNVGTLENGTSKLHKSKNSVSARRVEMRTNEMTKMSESRTEMTVEKTIRENVNNNIEMKKDATLPTNGEVFRQQMYDEYIRKMLERQERKNHKVVKISSHENILKTDSKSDDMNVIEKEFIEKARSRLNKYEINLDESETDHEEKEHDSDGTISAKCLIDGKELEDTRKLPKHLREFLKISTIINDEGGRSCNIVANGTNNENDLLHEIDKALKIGRGFLLEQENALFAPIFKASSTKPGVWSPGQTSFAKEPSPERPKEPQKDGAIPPVWIPANASPVAEKKEFRPVPFESPVLSRKKQPREEETTPPPWRNEEEKSENLELRSTYESSISRIVNSHSAPSQGLNTLASTTRLPRAQNPTITLLQKAREGQLPRGAAYLDKSEFIDNRSPIDDKPLICPGEIIYTLKKEYESEPETENEPPKKMADLGARKFEGIGPVTKEGIPLVLRSEVKESNQAKWYKRMYDSLHRANKNDDYITVRYKQKRGGRYGYGSSSGYLSEPEPRTYSDRSVTIDSRRRLRNKENDFTTATMPRRNGALKYSTEIYKNQPGRIEDYEPGHSSIAEKEAKEWWDEVMDIFDGWLNENGRPQHAQIRMESLRDVRQSHVLSLSQRPGDNHSVRIPVINSTKNSEVDARPHPLTPESSTDRSASDRPTLDRGGRPPSKSRLHWSISQNQSKPPQVADATDRSNEQNVDRDTGGRIIRTLEPAVQPCYWHATGMLEGRSKSFVLLDRCTRRLQPVSIERSTDCNVAAGQTAPLPVVVNASSSAAGDGIRHRYHRHHHHEHHQHYHPCYQNQEPQQRPSLSSSSTSSSFSSIDYIMLPSSPTTPSVTTQASSSRPFDQRNTRIAKPYMIPHGLKESGYESDSTLVFRRKEDVSPLSLLEQRLAYKTVQSGGDVPLHGLRKPAPERPKDDSEIEYFPISSSLTRIRVHRKSASKRLTISPSLKTSLARYERSAIFLIGSGPLVMRASQTKAERFSSSGSVYSSGTISSRAMPAPRPPSPPRRRSSHHSKTLKLYSETRVGDNPRSSKLRHEQCHAVDNLFNIKSLRERSCSSLERYRRSREQCYNTITRASSNSPVSSKATKVANLIPDTFGKRKSDPCLSRSRLEASTERKPSLIQSGVKNPSLLRSTREFAGAKFDGKHPIEDKLSKYTSIARGGQRSLEKRQVTVKLEPSTDVRKNKLRLTKREQKQSCGRFGRPQTELSSPIEVGKALQKHKEGSKEARDIQNKTFPLSTVVKSSTAYNLSASKQKRALNKPPKVLIAVSPKEQALLRKAPEQSAATRKTFDYQPNPSAKSISLAPKTITESKKTGIITRPQEKLIIGKGSSHLISSSKIRNDVNERKRPRQKSHTVARIPMKKPENIYVDINSNKKKIEIKRKTRRDKNGEEANKSLDNWKGDTKLERKMEKRESRKFSKDQIASSNMEKVKRHQKATRADALFQNLSRNIRSPTLQFHTMMKRSFVGERMKTFQNVAKENSEPYLKSFSLYLTNKRPVSDSKFKSWERENVSSRASSPYRICSPGRSVFQKVSRFESLLDIDEFGSSTTLRDRNTELQCAKERSLSEPPLKILPESRESLPRHSTLSLLRSRRIDASGQDELDASPTIVAKKIRARSAGEAEDAKRFGSDLSLTKSTCSLSSFDRESYQQYILELLHYKRKSKRYKDLLDFYASLGRVGQLEHRFSSGELRSRMRNEEIIDYDRWKQVRSKEKAEQELETLYGKLRTVQRDKNFLFTVNDVNKLRWRGDCRLRCKERSVEDILQYFKRLQTEESELESSRRKVICSQKDVYKPLWRGSSVVNVAATMQKRASTSHDADEFADQPFLQRSLGGSKKFWSSLSIEQVATLKKQLNEIYGSDGPQKPISRSNDEVTNVSHEVSDNHHSVKKSRDVNKRENLSNYEIVVPRDPGNDFNDHPQDDYKSLHVRCHSMIASNELMSSEECNPDSNRVEKSILKKSDSIGRLERSESGRSKSPVLMSELEKKRLSSSLSKEILSKMAQRRLSVPLVPRETRGSVAAAAAKLPAKNVAQSTSVPSTSSVSPRTCYSFETPCTDNSMKTKDKNYLLVLVPDNENATDKQRAKTVLEEWSIKPPLLTIAMPKDDSATKADESAVDNDTDNTTESSKASVKTVIERPVEAEHVSRKIEFFENVEKREEQQQHIVATTRRWKRLSSSQSFADLKELFGERRSAKYGSLGIASNIDRLRSTSLKERTIGGRRDDQTPLDDGADIRQQSPRLYSREHEYGMHDRPHSASPCRTITQSDSSSSLESGWLRSSSPDPEKYWRAYLKLVRNGTVRRLRSKFESVEDLPRRVKFALTPKRFRSDPELTRSLLKRTIEGGYADVACLRRRFETRRGRSPPIPRVSLRRENLSMPRIDIISKTAELKKLSSTVNTTSNHVARRTETKELEATRPVRRMRRKFESLNAEAQTSIMGEMFTSTPDIRELRNIAPYLAGQWVAHRYPSKRDNMRSLSSPADLELYQGGPMTDFSSRSKKGLERPRATSSSPIRPRASIFKPSQTVFAGQAFDPDKHRPRFRYQPPPPSVSPTAGRSHRNWWSNMPVYVARPIVTFEEYSNAPPPPPKSQHCRNDRQESPRRYVEGEVTIHYRSPVRTETKELLTEEELARRSAENMRRVYQEERRRKYLQELHDIDSRRHTDNFTPSQKSPIPLNRYDDFVDDLSQRNRSQDQTPEPRLVARALYNFVGQSSRELSFRRGDIIFVRRQVDKNWYEGEYNAMIGLFPFNYVEILPYDGMRTTPKKAHEGQARAKFNFIAQTNLELSLVKGELVVLTRRVDENWYEGRVGNRTGIFPSSYVEVITLPGQRSETSIQNKPVASPAAHSLLTNSSSGGKMSMGPHHYVPSIPVNINTIQPNYNSLPRMGGSKLHISQLSETLHIDTHSEPIPYRALYNYKPQNDDELELKEGDTVYVMEKCDDGWYVGSSQRTGYFGTFPGNYVDRL